MRDLNALKTREWLALPGWLRQDIIQWVYFGYVEEGTTLYHALRNDLSQTVGHASYDVFQVLRELVVALYNYTPATCWGSEAHVLAWARHAGLSGLVAQQEKEDVKQRS